MTCGEGRKTRRRRLVSCGEWIGVYFGLRVSVSGLLVVFGIRRGAKSEASAWHGMAKEGRYPF